MNKRAIAAAGGFAAIIVVGVWHVLLGGASSYDRGAVAVTAKSASVVASHWAAPGPGPVALHLKDPVESLWVRASPKEAARRAWRKRFERRYLRLGASHQFIDQMVAGNMVGALNNLKKQALSGDPAAISVYGDFTYWNCFLHGTSEQVDNYATMQTQKSPTLPAADAEWLRDAAAEDVAINKTVVAACREAVNVGQVFDMVDESAKQGDGANLFLSSKTANDMPEMQRRLRAAALAGSPDAQFEIAFTVLGGYQKELLGTGPDALNVGDLLRESAEQIPQAEGNLAICEFYGCGGIDADPTAGVRTALTAAEHGSFDALLDIGPHLGPSQLDPTDFDVLRFGRPSVAVCDDKDLDLQVTASDGEEGTVILRARIQRVARPQPDEFGFGKPTAVDTAWSSESPPLRVRYGKSAEVSMTDQDHKTWKVALYPDRMRGAIRQVRVDQ